MTTLGPRGGLCVHDTVAATTRHLGAGARPRLGGGGARRVLARTSGDGARVLSSQGRWWIRGPRAPPPRRSPGCRGWRAALGSRQAETR